MESFLAQERGREILVLINGSESANFCLISKELNDFIIQVNYLQNGLDWAYIQMAQPTYLPMNRID